MKNSLSLAVGAVIVICTCAYLVNHIPALKPMPDEAPAQPTTAAPPEAAEAASMITYAGPIANYVQGAKSSAGESRPAAPGKPDASDLIVASPSGTGGVILHKTFAVATTAKFPFEIAAHATNPKLRGTYRSFLRPSADAPADGDANVEFLLMNQQQYADFLLSRPADALYFVESSHSQQVNFDLAPTFDQPAQYYLVFRDRSGVAKKIVQADFSVDF